MKIADLLKLSKNYSIKIEYAEDLYDEKFPKMNIHDIRIVSENQFKIEFSCEMAQDFSEIEYGPNLNLELKKELDYADLMIDDSFINLWKELINLFDNIETIRES